MNPPGPKNGLLGWTHLQRLKKDPLGYTTQLARTYGDMTGLRVGPFRLYLVNHPDLIHEVLVVRGKSFRKSPYQTRVFAKVDGNGLIITEGDFWLRQRRLVQPALHPKRLKHYASEVVARAQRLADSWPAGATLNLVDEMKRLALSIVAKTMFGVEIGQEAADLGKANAILSEVLTREFYAPILLPDWLPLPGKRRKRWAMNILDGTIRRIIAERRASGEDKGDLLSMLLLAVDEEGDKGGMTDQQARDEAITLFNAGHDTSAAGLTWVWYLLAQNPKVEERLLQEVDQSLAGRPPTFDDLPNLKFADYVVKETLRLFPPTWALFTRVAQEPLTLGGYDIPRGGQVMIFPYVTHHDARFFADPEQFDPERFAPPRAKQIPQGAYIPFGAGPHVCIGNAFAMMEMTLAVVTVLQRVRLTLKADHPPVELEPLVALRPKGGLWMTVQQR